MNRTADADTFRALLSGAAARIEEPYFPLPVATRKTDKRLLQYRERVYAYELYHQLRCHWPIWRYSLAGEVDKRGHPLVRGPQLDRAKPDLLVHVPGQMNENLAVVEIKVASAATRELAKDVDKLRAFRTDARYGLGILLVFGETFDVSATVAAASGPVDPRYGTTVEQVRRQSGPRTFGQVVPRLPAEFRCCSIRPRLCYGSSLNG
jgi:hypothetical protein